MTSKLLVSLTVTAATLAASGDSLQGDWRGMSLCQQRGTACRDEKVVYHVSMPDSAGHVTIDADKIVDGKPVNMGRVAFTYDKTKQTLSGDDGPRIWHFDVKGNAMSGTLTTSGALIRKVDLRKD